MDSTTTVPSGSASLLVRTWGTTGSALVALHPGVGDSRIWDSCAPAWVGAGHRVVAYDRRGFGATTYQAEDHDDRGDLRAVLDASGIERAVLVGNSMGGGLAIDFALAHPERTEALVLVAPSPSGYDTDDWPTAPEEADLDDRIAVAEDAGDLELVNRLETHYWLDGVAQPEGRVSGDARALFETMNWAALRAEPTGTASTAPPAWPQLERLDLPVLVVVGALDLPGVVRLGRELVAAVPSAALVELPRSAHCPQLDDPVAFADVVSDFVSRVQGRPGR